MSTTASNSPLNILETVRDTIRYDRRV